MPDLTPYDYAIIAVYFIFMALIGLGFRKLVGDSSDYFRGGGRMLWWMAGSSAFMTQFSAWTFTGAASKAYIDGPIILVVFFANALGFFISFWIVAARFRQSRVITPVEAIRRRFGAKNEQFFTWFQIPIGTMYAGIWLNALGVFFSAVFGFDLVATIVVTGVAVLFVSLVGGAWAVSASDFMQVLVLMLITVVCAAYALFSLDSPASLITDFPAPALWGNGIEIPAIVWLWIVAIVIKQVISVNSLLDSNRYLCARDTREAKRAALLAACLFVIGPIIWFIPPMTAAIQMPELAAIFPQVEKPSEAAFVAISAKLLPAGMMGILISGMFAATMSSMDTGLNRNAGIFVRNFYLPILRKDAGEKELVQVGKASTLVMGILVIGVALFLTKLKDLTLFDIMLQFGALIAMPLSIPLVLGVFYKRTPDWAAWSTVLLGMTISWLLKNYFHPEWIASFLNIENGFTDRESNDLVLISGIFVIVSVCSAWFFATRLFYKEKPDDCRQKEVEELFTDFHTPVAVGNEPSGGSSDQQRRVLGFMAAAYGGFIAIMLFIPNDWFGRSSFAISGLVLGLIGWALIRRSRSGQPN
jgi:Na+/proline symporter